MIGAAKMGLSVAASTNYAVFITPTNYENRYTGKGAVSSVSYTANVTGGIGPFTYLWERISGDIITINSPTTKATTFSTFSIPGESRTTTMRVTVTDTGNGNITTDSTEDILFIFEEF